MLSRLEKQGSLLTARPFPTHFPGPSAPSPAVLWDAIADWLRRGERNAVLLQFVRILYPTEAGDTALDLLQRCGRRYAHAVRFQY